MKRIKPVLSYGIIMFLVFFVLALLAGLSLVGHQRIHIYKYPSFVVGAVFGVIGTIIGFFEDR